MIGNRPIVLRRSHDDPAPGAFSETAMFSPHTGPPAPRKRDLPMPCQLSTRRATPKWDAPRLLPLLETAIKGSTSGRRQHDP